MPANPSGVREGFAIASGVLALGLFFGWRQWVERSRRDPEDLSEADRTYFVRKDLRRFVGSAILVLIAAGMVFGLRINPRADRASGRLFGWIWIGVSTLVCVSLILAFLDWIANRDYALRQRRALARERRELFESEARKRNAESPGSNGIARPSETS